MKANVGKSDRIVRIVLALLLGAAGIYLQSWWGLLALVPLVTAFVSWCPLYSLFGVSTCPLRTQKN